MSVPPNICDFYSRLSDEKHAELHTDFKSSINAVRIDFVKDEAILKIVTRDESSQVC